MGHLLLHFHIRNETKHHFFRPNVKFLVKAGSIDNTISDNYMSQKNVYEVKKIILHPYYVNDNSRIHDLAVLKLKSPIRLMEKMIEKINLPPPNLELGMF